MQMYAGYGVVSLEGASHTCQGRVVNWLGFSQDGRLPGGQRHYLPSLVSGYWTRLGGVPLADSPLRRLQSNSCTWAMNASQNLHSCRLHPRPVARRGNRDHLRTARPTGQRNRRDYQNALPTADLEGHQPLRIDGKLLLFMV